MYQSVNGPYISIPVGSKNITAPIVDYYTASSVEDVGLSPAGFEKFANVTEGIVSNATWSIN